MTVDRYMPDVKVEIAFNAGYTTPAASRTWTDVSSYVELEPEIDIDFGRQDERSTADANSLSLTLDNSDGRFTANRAASPYYPNVKVGRPIRVTVTPNNNYCPNGGFEVDDAGWATNGALGSYGLASEARSTTRAYSGAASLLITWPTHATGSWDGVVLHDQLESGQTYTASCRVWVPAGSPDPRIERLFGTTSARTSTKNAWVYLEHTFVAGANDFVGIQVATPTAGQQCWVDEFMVNRGSVALPYTSEVATPSDRFVGFVDEWPVEWDGSDAYAMAPITASSRLARLGLGAKLRSMPEEQILSDGPVGYWTLGDPQGSRAAAESSGNNVAPLEGVFFSEIYPGLGWNPFVFAAGTGAATDELPAIMFDGVNNDGDRLTAPEPIPIATAGPRSLRCWAVVTEAPATFDTPLVLASGVSIWLRTTGTVGGASTTGPFLVDGQAHDIVVTRDGTNERLYIDGSLYATAAAGTGPANPTISAGFFTGTLAHVAIYDRALSAGEVAAQAEVMTASTVAERTDERLIRILDWAGVPATEITVEAGDATMTYQKTSGQSVIDASHDVESTEAGVLFDDRDGNVTFHNRSHRYALDPAVELSMTSQHVARDYRPKLDRSKLTNDVTAENPITEQSIRLVDAASRDEYGWETDEVTVISTSDAVELPQRCAWLLVSYAEPAARVPSLTVDVVAHQGLTPSAQDLLAVTMGDRIRVTNQPTQADATTVDYFVEGYTERIGPESYDLTFNLSPVWPAGNVLILDHATRAGLDEGNILGL